MEWHSAGIKEVFEELRTGKEGLSQAEAALRLKKYGFNEIEEKRRISPLKILLAQFKSLLVLVLIAAVAISVFLGETVDAAVIGAVVVLNALLGFMQEYKAEKSIEALKRMAALKATVIRGGEKRVIPAKELVPGDILIIDEGDKISADARLFECYSFETMEASLTGESEPNSKEVSAIRSQTPLADRVNMVYSGTIATRGRAIAVVTETGMQTELGKVAELIETAEKEIPLARQLDKMGKWIGIGVLVLCLILFLLQVIKGGSIIYVFITALALAVAAIPEGLPAVVTIALALGVQKMAKRNALVRRLPSVEALGSTTVICTDKTGTLTMNAMTVKKLYANGEIIEVSGEGYSKEGKFSIRNTKSIEMLLRTGLLCNNAAVSGNAVVGDPTEGALIISAAKLGLDKHNEEREYVRIDEIPFSSERKMMSTLHKHGRKKFAFVKGATKVILGKCKKILINGKIRHLTPSEKEKILEIEDKFASNALRVLAFAYRECLRKEDAEKDLIFIGLQGMIDPPRAEAKQAIEKCKAAGIKVVMITGDQKLTAEAIAKVLGLEGKTILGEELEMMDAKELSRIVDDVAVYARVNPEHKLKIVTALKQKGHIVAMTGDGVNDAPALKEANIGIAMGINGTEVAKEASDMVLMDDNFASIVNAVEEGRGIYDNIRKFTTYLLSSNLAEVLIVLIAILMSLPMPFIAVQILWINLITDSFPALALGVDPKAENVMMRRPRAPKERIINRNMALSIALIAIAGTIATLWLFNRYLPDEKLARTVAFTTLVCVELIAPFVVKARFSSRIFSNPWLIGATILSFALQLVVIYTPLSSPFATVPIIGAWAYIGTITAALAIIGITCAVAIRKMMSNKELQGKINKF